MKGMEQGKEMLKSKTIVMQHGRDQLVAPCSSHSWLLRLTGREGGRVKKLSYLEQIQ